MRLIWWSFRLVCASIWMFDFLDLSPLLWLYNMRQSIFSTTRLTASLLAFCLAILIFSLFAALKKIVPLSKWGMWPECIGESKGVLGSETLPPQEEEIGVNPGVERLQNTGVPEPIAPTHNQSKKSFGTRPEGLVNPLEVQWEGPIPPSTIPPGPW